MSINEKTKCCGCTACMSICPKQCIEMIDDEEGFTYPLVNKDKCIKCGICDKVCPVSNPPIPDAGKREMYVLRSKSMDIVRDSTSGGFFTPFAEWILGQGGIICAAAYNDDFSVSHQMFDGRTYESMPYDRFRGSKYVQSNMGDCFMRIKSALMQNRTVGFVGTTCQVSGLKTYLGKQYDNLITIDVICKGTSSPKLWKKYLEYQIEKHKSEILEVSFRYKTYGYHSGTMKIKFANQKCYYGSARIDYMLKSYYSEISSRPICYQCPFKQLEHCSDFSLYDCWHASELVHGLKDDDKGYTNVIIQSDHGREILNLLKDKYEIFSTDTALAVQKDGVMICKSAVPHTKRSEFYKELDNESLPAHIQKFIPITTMDYIIEHIKAALYKVGLLKFLKKI